MKFQTLEKEEGWMKLDEHGKQKHMGQTLTPQELNSTLTKGKSKKWEEKFKAAIKEDWVVCAGVRGVQHCGECQTLAYCQAAEFNIIAFMLYYRFCIIIFDGLLHEREWIIAVLGNFQGYFLHTCTHRNQN